MNLCGWLKNKYLDLKIWKRIFPRTSSSLITGESRSLLSSSCFSHSNIFISSLSVVELPPPPGLEVVNNNEELSAFIDDIDRLDEDFIERSSVKLVVLDWKKKKKKEEEYIYR